MALAVLARVPPALQKAICESNRLPPNPLRDALSFAASLDLGSGLSDVLWSELRKGGFVRQLRVRDRQRIGRRVRDESGCGVWIQRERALQLLHLLDVSLEVVVRSRYSRIAVAVEQPAPVVVRQIAPVQ